MIEKLICVVLLATIVSASSFGCMAHSGGPNMPQSFKNCKVPVCQNGPYTGYGCNNGICPYICYGGACLHVGGSMAGPNGFQGRQIGGHPGMGGPFPMQDPSFGGFGGAMLSGPGSPMMDPFGNPSYDGYDPYGYGQDMGYSSASGRRGRSKRESCPDGDCEDDEKSADSSKSSSGSSN